jgi:hypothetical protein
MKKILLLFSLSLLMFSCSSGPEKVAENFLENLSKGKVDEAKKYATESTGKMLDFVSSMTSLPVDPDFKFNPVRDSIVGNKAWIFYLDKNDDENSIELVKIDGDWKVNVEAQK